MSVSDSEQLAYIKGQIASTPSVFRTLLQGLTADDMSWKPQPSRYSIAEILAHVSHADEHCFGFRVRQMLSEDEPALPVYDDDSFLQAPADYLADGAARLSDFQDVRARWAAFLNEMTTEAASRRGSHPQFGSLSIGEILHVWAFHDLGHLRQIAEIVRARRLYSGIGPFQSRYAVRP